MNTASYALRDLTVPAVLDRQVAAAPDKVFLTETSGRRYTYAELDRWSNAVANALRARGIESGTHVGVVMANSAEHIALFFAIAKLGAVSVPVNTAARGDLLRYYLTQSDCRPSSSSTRRWRIPTRGGAGTVDAGASR